MPMYNLLEYSDNYSMKSGSLWNYYKFEVNDPANENKAANCRINNNEKTTSRYFEYRTKIIGETLAITIGLDTKVVDWLRYLGNFKEICQFAID